MPTELQHIDIESRTGVRLEAYQHIYQNYRTSRIRRIFWYVIISFIILMFIPWTQNIRSEGSVTTLRQEQRPQQVNTILPGRIVKWWVKEGDMVKKGDTILQLAEVKDDYLDPNLLQRTQQQIDAENLGITFNEGKVTTTQQQMTALKSNGISN